MSCPPELRQLSRMLRENQQGTDAVVLLCDAISYVLVGSFFLAPLAAGPAALSTFLTIVSSDCDVVEGLQQKARSAAFGCDVILAICAVATSGVVLTALTIVGLTIALPSAAALAPFVAIFASLRVVLVTLGAGRTPATDAVLAVTVAGLGLVDPELARKANQAVKNAIDFIEENASVRALLPRARELQNEEATVADNDLSPMIQWPQNEAPPFGHDLEGDGRSLEGLYQRRYLAAARTTWHLLGNQEDLRPWVIAQTESDLRYVRAQQLSAQNSFRSTVVARLASVLRMLNNWQVSALPTGAGGVNAPGPWAQATVVALLKQRGRLSGLPVGGSEVDDSGVGEEGGGGALALGLGVVAAIAVALKG